MIAKQIEPPNTGMEHIAVEYSDDGRLWALRKPLDYRDLVYMVRNDCLIVTNSEGAGFRGDSLSELGKFLDAIRHLREAEDEALGDSADLDKPEVCPCGFGVPSPRLEKAIELLDDATKCISAEHGGSFTQDVARRIRQFLSRVGGDNE